jgi:hypothetical protein
MTSEQQTREPGPRWYFYEERPGSWRWDLVSATGEVLERSTSSFSSRQNCVGNAKARGYGMTETPHARIHSRHERA